jgi:transcriptional regulator with GAF, ATPase, and Fis domain
MKPINDYNDETVMKMLCESFSEQLKKVSVHHGMSAMIHMITYNFPGSREELVQIIRKSWDRSHYKETNNEE